MLVNIKNNMYCSGAGCCAHTGRQGSAGWTAEALGQLMLLSPFTCGCARLCGCAAQKPESRDVHIETPCPKNC
jgi:hypothetical protein